MIPVLAAELPPVDACQSPDCHPGIADACVPVGPVVDVDGGKVADYECPGCGDAWTTLFDAHGWVVERMAADITEVREAA